MRDRDGGREEKIETLRNVAFYKIHLFKSFKKRVFFLLYV